MGKLLLREYVQVCTDGICKNIQFTPEEKELKEKGYMVLASMLQKADFKNQNQREYPFSILLREFKNFERLIQEGRALGELDHSDESIVNLKNASHRFLRIWNNPEKEFWGTFVILPNEKGKILQSIIETKGVFGLSSRALGSLSKGHDGVNIVGEDLELITVDAVADPSTTGALSQLLEVNERQIKEVHEFQGKSYHLNKLLNNILS